MFTLTTSAAQQIQQAAASSGAQEMALRIAAKIDPDGSKQYGMGFDDHREQDSALEFAGLQVLAALQSHGLTLKEMCADLVFYPQKLVNVRVQPGFKWTSSQAITAAVAAAEAELGDTGRILLRPSGTEPLLRVMVEGRDGEQVSRLAHSLAEIVKAAAA